MPQLPAMWKVAEDFSTFIFWMLANLPKYSYGWSPLEQHHKTEGKTTILAACFLFGIPHCFKILSSVAISMISWEKAVKIQEKNSQKPIHGSK